MSQNEGNVTPEIVAKDAFEETSPLYDLFEHDHEVAAHEYHKVQARQITNNLVVITLVPKEKTFSSETPNPFSIQEDEDDFLIDDAGFVRVQTRAFPYVEGRYRPLATVTSEKDLQRQYKETILKELKSAARKARDFGVYADAVEAIEAIPEPSK